MYWFCLCLLPVCAILPNCVHVLCVKPLINLAISNKNYIYRGSWGHIGCSRCSVITFQISHISVFFCTENYSLNDQLVFTNGCIPVDTHDHDFPLQLSLCWIKEMYYCWCLLFSVCISVTFSQNKIMPFLYFGIIVLLYFKMVFSSVLDTMW